MPAPTLPAQVAAALLWGAVCLLVCGLLVLAAWLARNAAAVGAVEVRVRRRVGIRLALLAGYVLAAACVLALARDLPALPLTLVLVLGLALLAASPGFQDSKFGARGVQRGWHARRFAELEEWRLTGDHLRWKLFGTWLATDLPRARHAAAREKLLAAAPERESRFNQ